MNNLEKVGYILIGVGIGGFIATLWYERELNKPIGDIEEYIPFEDREDVDESDELDELDESNDILENSSDKEAFSKEAYIVAKQYTSADNDIDDRRKEFEQRRHADKNQSVRYNKMYEGKVEVPSPIHEIVHTSIISDSSDIDAETARQLRLQELGATIDELDYEDDGPQDDIENDFSTDDLVRERVENNFEIYLGENPQDFVPLIFYNGDNTLADDSEHVVPSAFDVVGEVALSRLITGGPGAEEGVIYVRNLKTMIDYEIVLDAGSYSETVLGVFLDQKRKSGEVDRNGST